MARVKKKWRIRRQHADFKKIGAELGVDPLLVWMMMNRGIPESGMAEYLHPDQNSFQDPHFLLHGPEAAAEILEAVRNHKKIRIIGDYDIDGIMSTYILHTAFLRVGADCDWRIPHRVRDGYGLNPRLVAEAAADDCDMIVTCDNGIAARDAVRMAKEQGLQVVVTDHHAIPRDEDGQENLPPADQIVNPHLEKDPSPFKEICGAVVAWKLVALLYEQAGIPKEEWGKLLPFAAIATIGDVMPLQKENRAIVKLGLRALKNTDNVGLLALIREKKLDPANLTAYHVGFVLGPCLNAAGRLESASLGVDLLETTDPVKAGQLAVKLSELNEARKGETEKGVDEAEFLLKTKGWDKDRVLVIYEPDISESVVGIVAGRIRERTNKPTIVLTDGQEEVKGSARSIEAYPMYDKLCEVSDLLDKFGGHPMAAGMSLPRENVDRFRQALNEKCTLTEDDLASRLVIDADMNFRYLLNHPELIDDLDLLEPYGSGNEKPVFAESHVRVLRMRSIGKEGQYLKFQLSGKYDTKIDALYFGDGNEMKQELEEAFGAEEVRRAMWGQSNRLCLTVAYYPTRNTFRGVTSTEIIISDYLIPVD